jgi:hypothetical protein
MKEQLSVLKRRAAAFLSAMAAGMIAGFAQSFMM